MQEPDWLRLGRYALLIALSPLIPIPLLDAHVETVLRRRLVRRLAENRGVTLEHADVKTLADIPGGGCLGILSYVLLWPLRKLLRVVFFVLSAKSMADTFSEVVHRGLLLTEALEHDLLPQQADKVRASMDGALEAVDTSMVTRTLTVAFKESRSGLSAAMGTIRSAVGGMQDEEEALERAAESHELDAYADRFTTILDEQGATKALTAHFRDAMGIEVV